MYIIDSYYTDTDTDTTRLVNNIHYLGLHFIKHLINIFSVISLAYHY